MSTSEELQFQLPGMLWNDGITGLERFYLPVLARAAGYTRILPYGSATSWWIVGQGFSALLNRGPTCRIRIGFVVKAMPAVDTLMAELEAHADLDFRRRLALIGFALDYGMLEVRFIVGEALVASRGFVEFDDGNSLSFISEHDSSRAGLVGSGNREVLLIFQRDSGFSDTHQQAIEMACDHDWSASDGRRRSEPLPPRVRHFLLQCAQAIGIDSVLDEVRDQQLVRPSVQESGVTKPFVPKTLNRQEFSIRHYQQDALQEWRRNGFKGMLQLATGAGKTIIAAYAAAKIFERDSRLALVIGVPYQALADQWVESLEAFGFMPIRCYESRANWYGDAVTLASAYNAGSSPVFCAVVVNRTLASLHFQQLLKTLVKDHMVFIGDECHHYLGETWQNILPRCPRRLGLSATPLTEDNTDANERLESYFGPVCYEYRLEQAIQDKVLAPYDYHVYSVDLTDEELTTYGDLAKQIAEELGPTGDPETGHSSNLLRLLMERARLFSTAANKLARLRKLLEGQSPTSHTLFYCAEGQADLGLDEEVGDVVLRHVEWVSVQLYELGWNVARFTAQEGRNERRDILQRFRLGDVEGLVAIRCLDEGIDIPACSTAYILASSRNPRQWIQRRGRVLRTAPGKNKAVIHDFVVVVPTSIRQAYRAEGLMYERELARIQEFAQRAQNRQQVLPAIAEIRRVS
jgi:superfamily II DNA or RNA helicase